MGVVATSIIKLYSCVRKSCLGTHKLLVPFHSVPASFAFLGPCRGQNLLQGLHHEWLCKVCDSVHLQQKGGCTVFSDTMPKEYDGGQPGLALVWVDNQEVLTES